MLPHDWVSVYYFSAVFVATCEYLSVGLGCCEMVVQNEKREARSLWSEYVFPACGVRTKAEPVYARLW